MKNKDYRFKTEKEFEKEFGERWRTSIPYMWPIEMDKFLGKVIRMSEVLYLEKNYLRYNGWTIHPSMMTTRRLPKYLKDGTQIRVGMKLMWDETKCPIIVRRIYIDFPNRVEAKCLCTYCTPTKNLTNEYYLPLVEDLSLISQ